jgi:hypothetical protein
MRNILKRFAIFALALGVGAAATVAVAQVDPPSRVGRLSQVSGAVSFAPAGEDEWVAAVRNRPIVTGDRLWVSEGSRAELQLGSAVLYLGSATSIAVLNLDDRIAQFRVEQGTLVARVRRLAPESEFEIDTPNLAFAVRRPGEYRIDVDIVSDSTAVGVRSLRRGLRRECGLRDRRRAALCVRRNAARAGRVPAGAVPRCARPLGAAAGAPLRALGERPLRRARNGRLGRPRRPGIVADAGWRH